MRWVDISDTFTSRTRFVPDAFTDLEAAQSAEQVAEARFNSSLNSVREKMALVDVQSAQLALAKQQLEDTVVVAPLDGVVLNRLVAIGT